MKLITIHLVVDVIFNVYCFLCNFSEEENSKGEIDLLNFIVVVIFKRCWYLSILTKELAATFWSSYTWRESKSYYQKRLEGLRTKLVKEVSRSNLIRQKQKTVNEGNVKEKKNVREKNRFLLFSVTSFLQK